MSSKVAIAVTRLAQAVDTAVVAFRVRSFAAVPNRAFVGPHLLSVVSGVPQPLAPSRAFLPPPNVSLLPHTFAPSLCAHSHTAVLWCGGLSLVLLVLCRLSHVLLLQF